jgi:hypothetical protein
MENKKYNVESITMAQIPKSEISQEILDLLKGKETYVDTDMELMEKIYSVSVLVELMGETEEMGEQDLSETIYNLYVQIQDYNYLQVVSI